MLVHGANTHTVAAMLYSRYGDKLENCTMYKQ